MVKIIFVCYDAGAGGEKLATDISKFSNVYNLASKSVGTRTVTNDVTKGISRNDIFRQHELQSVINDLPNDKWHVIPTHFRPSELQVLSCVKFYVVIYAGSVTSEKQIDQNQYDFAGFLSMMFENFIILVGHVFEQDDRTPHKIN